MNVFGVPPGLEPRLFVKHWRGVEELNPILLVWNQLGYLSPLRKTSTLQKGNHIHKQVPEIQVIRPILIDLSQSHL